jgi:crotonobetainyl-CoA:carnitine CoA-transferase CaiB-like acyl-CoA transferase
VGGLLQGVRVVDLTGESGQLAGRALADLGADVTLVEPTGGSPVRHLPPYDTRTGESLRFLALNSGKTIVEYAADAPERTALIEQADIVLADGPPPGEPSNIWVAITPFGLDGPRAHWRATDLTLVAAGGNLYPTGDPDRAPVACREPTSYAHVAGEAVIAALTALWTQRPTVVDVSIQETMLVVSMAGPARFPTEKQRGKRRGAFTGRTREIWPCADGFVSFGLRGGKARLKNLAVITQLCADASVNDAAALTERDWATYNPAELNEAELDRISAPIAEYFAARSMRELYQTAVDTGLMLAPANSPRELLASDQLAARGFFTTKDGVEQFPGSFVIVHHGERGAVPEATQPGGQAAAQPWRGLVLLEFGSGAAGPIATRYFADQGATIIKVESTTRPDFLRSYGDVKQFGMDGSAFFSVLNAGKHSLTLNMKDPRGVNIAKRLVMRADAVSENFAPKAMAAWGMDYATLANDKPDLVMISACLQGQTGPHKDYPGFGGQGAALSGYNFLTGWPDREPLGPHGTITDSLAPRFVAAALAAGLWHHRQTGEGCYLDLAQVEAALFTLSPWLLDYSVNGTVYARDGNRSDHMSPHGVFPCADDDGLGDRWVAVACRDDVEWASLATLLGVEGDDLATIDRRKPREDEVEKLIADWTSRRTPTQAAAELQAAGVTAYEVHDFGTLHDDPQLLAREHFVQLEHPRLGYHHYERDGFRLSASQGPDGPWRPGPLLGQHNEEILRDLLDMDPDEIARLAADGVLS